MGIGKSWITFGGNYDGPLGEGRGERGPVSLKHWNGMDAYGDYTEWVWAVGSMEMGLMQIDEGKITNTHPYIQGQHAT